MMSVRREKPIYDANLKNIKKNVDDAKRPETLGGQNYIKRDLQARGFIILTAQQ